MRTASFDAAAIPKRWLYLAFLLMAVLMTFPLDLWDLWRIAKDPGQATGVITYLDCPNHGRVDYVFQVNGASVAGSRHHVGSVSCRELHFGQKLAVHYQRALPVNNIALLADQDGGNRAMEEFYAQVRLAIGFIIGAPLFLLLVWTVFTGLDRLWRAR